jgi:RecA-family ATPase
MTAPTLTAVELQELDADVRTLEHDDPPASFEDAVREVVARPFNRAGLRAATRGEPYTFPTAAVDAEADRVAGALRALRKGRGDQGAAVLHAGRFDGARAEVPRRSSGEVRERVDLAPGMLRRGAVSLLVGATHVGKTLVTHGGIVAAGVLGREFLERPVTAARWLVVDAENSADDIYDVWTAAGLSEANIAESIRLVDREQVAELGLHLSDPDARDWLLEQARRHRADALVLDSLGMLAGVKLTEDQAAAELYRETLKPLAVRGDLGLLLTHHETKYGRAGSDTGYQGAGQVTAQADTVLTMRQTRKLEQEPEGAQVRTSSSVALRQAKHRPRGAGWTEHVDIAGVVAGAQDGAELLELSVGLRGAQAVSDADRFLAALEGPTPPGLLAERLGWDRTGKRFRGVRDALEDAGRIETTGAGKGARIVALGEA